MLLLPQTSYACNPTTYIIPFYEIVVKFIVRIVECLIIQILDNILKIYYNIEGNKLTSQ
jgi:hypothetical protein